jgi:Co/Zn/Cd efflux system component
MIKDFMNVDKWQMNQHIYISQIVDAIREIPGIINVVDIRFYNMEGGIYSNTVISQATGQRTNILNTGVRRTQIEPISNAIFSTPMSMFQIRQPETDILVRTS